MLVLCITSTRSLFSTYIILHHYNQIVAIMTLKELLEALAPSYIKWWHIHIFFKHFRVLLIAFMLLNFLTIVRSFHIRFHKDVLGKTDGHLFFTAWPLLTGTNLETHFGECSSISWELFNFSSKNSVQMFLYYFAIHCT